MQKASSAQDYNAAFPEALSCLSRSPCLLVKMFLTAPVELVIGTTLVGAICSGSRTYEQVHLNRYLGLVHMMLHIDSRAHKPCGIF